ncbi:MAG: alanyl-tRNA editing protein [Acidimicrobiia bacterium]|nr:alanyl-tRNA editing protein [Acidimicrobiia bacterium]MDH5423276.1 alanyl-tRNA editing protein [Acidimicrobiia bacterium]MDH5503316.1 alanyl-tRNA editing protein [Acidimicrobiia bacterium]
MATQEIAATDSYATSTDATVVAVMDEGIVLDSTVFYARGGGQPGDTGTLVGEFGELNITDTFRVKGDPIHQFDGKPPRVGERVTATIDWGRRYLLMRTHTALHALTAIIYRDFGAKVTGGDMKPGVARMDFELASMSREFAEDIARKLNDELHRGYDTEIRFMDREVALADPDLIRTKVNLLPESLRTIRVVDIVGLDKQADGGTHVRSTLEVGSIQVLKTESKGKANKRMRIEIL